MEEHLDFGISVSDARRLNDCWRELFEAFEARTALDGDDGRRGHPADGSPGNEGQAHQVNSRNMAETILLGAIRDHALPVWFRLTDREERADANAITKLSQSAVATGVYRTENDPKSSLEGRPLWIKNADWDSFYAGLMASRYAEHPPPTDLAQALVADVKGAFTLAEDQQFRTDELTSTAPVVVMASDGELPIWLNMYQLKAWVLYRDLAIVAKADDFYGLASQNIYGTEAKVGGHDHLEQALQSGELIAYGARRGESFAAIPPVEWTRLRIAPLSLADQWPYVAIQVSRADAEALFPAAGGGPTPTAAIAPKRGSGRSPGSGSYASADAPLLSEMKQLTASGKVMSAHAAAQLVADRATGAGTFESKVSRLGRAYRSLERNGAH